jgi:glycerophosphoryl diester phosphodiesterase
MQKTPNIIAHAGGGTHAPENTLAAFERGLTDGADGFELDIHLSRDGVPVVTHDFTLERVAGIDRPVGALTAAELAELDAGSWFGPAFAGQHIPTLEQVLSLVEGKELYINIEIKAGSRLYPGIEETCLSLARQTTGGSTFMFSSFDHYALQRIKEIDSQALTGALHGCALIDAHEYGEKIGVDALHPQYMIVDSGFMAGCSEKGLQVNAWTVNDPEQARRLWRMGVDGIITDDPAGIRAAIEDDNTGDNR